VQGVEDDHALLHRDVELVEAAVLTGTAAEDPESRPRSSSGIVGIGLVSTRMVPSGPFATTLLRRPHVESSSSG
jgi:hypothetical protein